MNGTDALYKIELHLVCVQFSLHLGRGEGSLSKWWFSKRDKSWRACLFLYSYVILNLSHAIQMIGYKYLSNDKLSRYQLESVGSFFLECQMESSRNDPCSPAFSYKCRDHSKLLASNTIACSSLLASVFGAWWTVILHQMGHP